MARWPSYRPERVAQGAGLVAGTAGQYDDRCRSARARWSWPATTPARRPAAWPRRPAGRCWPSPPAVRAPASTRSAATGCSSAARSARRSSGSWSSATRRCPAPSPACWRRGDVEVWSAAPTGLGLARPLPGRAGTFDRVEAAAARRPRTGSQRWRDADARVGRDLDAAARRRARPHAVRRRGRGRAGAAAREPAGRRRLEPDPRPRPDGAALPGRRAAQGDRQPRPVRHRRRRLDRGRRRPRPHLRPQPGPARRRDVPPRQQRTGPRRPRAASPTSRSWSSTTTAARSSRCSSRAPRSTPTATTASSARRTASTWRALCAATRTPHLRVTSLPELEQALASPNGGIEVIEAVVRRDNRRDLDERIRALGRGDLSKPDQDEGRRSGARWRMSLRRRHLRRVRRRSGRRARRPRGERRGLGSAAPLLALPLRPDHQVRRRRAAAGAAPSHPARARGVPDDHDEGAAHRHRRRGRLLLPRGVHARVHQGLRRAAARVAQEARPHPDR